MDAITDFFGGIIDFVKGIFEVLFGWLPGIGD
jgi:hypothetical protein